MLKTLFILLGCGISLISYSAEMENMRDKRYCEIIIRKSLEEYAVYNTWGLNDCPPSLWSKITEVEVKKETNAGFVHLNGPRYWTIDGFKKTELINPTTKTIAALQFREAGILKLNLADLVKSIKPYEERKVKRETTWIYQAGKPIFVLIDPKGQVFVMQSYSDQKIQQTPASLANLGQQLKLPKGWAFKTMTLDENKTVKAVDNLAVVIQDDNLNTYQLAAKDFLAQHSDNAK